MPQKILGRLSENKSGEDRAGTEYHYDEHITRATNKGLKQLRRISCAPILAEQLKKTDHDWATSSEEFAMSKKIREMDEETVQMELRKHFELHPQTFSNVTRSLIAILAGWETIVCEKVRYEKNANSRISIESGRSSTLPMRYFSA